MADGLVMGLLGAIKEGEDQVDPSGLEIR